MARGKHIALLLPLLLGGCTEIYIPQAIEVTDASRYAADLAECQQAAANYRASFDLASVARATINGATQNASNSVISPYVPLVGAAGGAVGSIGNAAGLMGQQKHNVARHCILELTHRDRSALIADPD